MKENNPLISIVIPTHDRVTQLQRLLQSIFHSTYKNIEIIIVNDSQKDLHVSKKRKSLKLIQNKKNKGLAYSRKIGVFQAKGSYILFVDDDNVVDKNMIGNLVTVLQKYPNLLAVGPVNYFLSQKKKIAFVGATIHLGTSKTTMYKSFDKDSLIAGGLFLTDNLHNCFLMRKKYGDEVKWFDEEIFMSGTEYDLFQRIKRLHPEYILATCTSAKCFHDILDISSSNLDTFVENYALRKKKNLLLSKE